MTKTCSHCGQSKPLCEFKGDGSRATCKVCDARRAKEYRKNNKAAVNERKRWKYQQDPVAREKRNAKTRAWRDKKRQEFGGTLAPLNRKYDYGLDDPAFDRLCEAYPVCGICGKETPLNTDHCHKTGRVRGRLCVNCNTAIGKLGDDIPGLMRAIEYLANPRF